MKRVQLIILLLMIFTLTISCENSALISNSNETKNEITEKTNNQSAEFYSYEKNINHDQSDHDFNIEMVKVLTEIGYTLEQATVIQHVLYSVGIYSINVIRETPEDVTKGLAPIVCTANGDEELHFFFTTEDGELFYCGFMDEDLYDSDKGGFIKQITDVHIPETIISITSYNELQQLAIENVQNYLNYPNSASFHALEWGVGRNDDKYKIIGVVSANNALGVKKDILFTIWFIDKNGVFSTEGVLIDGVRVK